MGATAQLFESLWNRTAIEVADRVQAELRVWEERNRSLLEYAKEGVMIVDAKAIVQFASPVAEHLAGIPPGEAVGHRPKDFTAVIYEGAVVYANQALAEFLGTTRQRLLIRADRDGFQFVHKNDRENVRTAFEGSGPDAPGSAEIRILRSGRRGWRWIQLKSAGAADRVCRHHRPERTRRPTRARKRAPRGRDHRTNA